MPLRTCLRTHTHFVTEYTSSGSIQCLLLPTVALIPTTPGNALSSSTTVMHDNACYDYYVPHILVYA